MSIGKLRNNQCPCGIATKIANVKGEYQVVAKYSDCCWDKDYWEGFSKSVVKIKDQRTQIEKEVTRYRRTP